MLPLVYNLKIFNFRYALFIEALTNSVLTNESFNQTQFAEFVFEKVEKPFAEQSSVDYPTEPKGMKLYDELTIVDVLILFQDLPFQL